MSDEPRPSERPRLQLKPRDPNAAQAYVAQRARAGSNPFGAAKPREQIIAERLGKTEEEVLKEAVKKERPKLRLNAEQLEQRKQAESRIEEVREQLGDTDEAERAALREELTAREEELEALLDKFEAMALEAAQRGEVQRPSERRQQQQLLGEGEPGRPVGRGGYGAAAGGDLGGGGYDRPRGQYDKEGRGDRVGGGGRGGYDYDRPRGGYGDRDGGGRGSFGSKGAWGGYDRGDSGGGAVYERAPRESYDRPERTTYDRDGARGDRDGGRGGSYDRSEGDYGGRGGAGSGGWNSGGGDRARGGGSYDRAGSYERRGGGGYDRSGQSGGADRGGQDPLPRGPSGGLDDGLRGGGGRGGGGPRGGYGPRGGRGHDSTLEDLTSTDYVSPYTINQDRF